MNHNHVFDFATKLKRWVGLNGMKQAKNTKKCTQNLMNSRKVTLDLPLLQTPKQLQCPDIAELDSSQGLCFKSSVLSYRFHWSEVFLRMLLILAKLPYSCDHCFILWLSKKKKSIQIKIKLKNLVWKGVFCLDVLFRISSFFIFSSFFEMNRIAQFIKLSSFSVSCWPGSIRKGAVLYFKSTFPKLYPCLGGWNVFPRK